MKIHKRRKLKKKRFLILLLLLFLFGFVLVRFIDIKVLNVNIQGNDNLTENEILKIAKLDEKPSYFSNLILVIKNRLEKNNYIKSAKVTKGFLSININIKEEKILYIDRLNNKKVTLHNSFKDSKFISAPELINSIPSNRIDSFKKAMNKINKKVLDKISEVKYDPNDIDKDRYLVYMVDGNKAYLTVNKFNKINKYDKYLENIGKQNGTLFLDYGNFFRAD